MPSGLLSRARRTGKAALFFVSLTAALPLLGGCGAKPVAVVNGTSLTEPEFAKLCETATEVDARAGAVGQQVLVRWMHNTMLSEEAKRLNVYPSEKDVAARLEAWRRQAAYAGRSFEDELKQRGTTEAAFKRKLLEDLVEENVVCNGVNVSDEEVKQFWDRVKGQLTQPERIRISQISVQSEADMKKVQDDLAHGTNFSLVASTRSKDQFAKAGGAVPFEVGRQVQAGMPVNQKAVDAAFKLNEGQWSDPIKLADGHWVFVKLEQRIPKKEPNFEDFRESVRSQLRKQKAQTTKGSEIQKGLTERMQKAQITINRPEYQHITAEIQIGRAHV